MEIPMAEWFTTGNLRNKTAFERLPTGRSNNLAQRFARNTIENTLRTCYSQRETQLFFTLSSPF